MPASHQPQDLAALGRQWVEAWNSRDLERVLSLYAEDTEMTSDRIPAMGFDPSGAVRGKADLRAYWSKALTLMLDQPSMIKRPVLDVGGKLIVGFKPEVYAKQFG